jgi:hypothetical protein
VKKRNGCEEESLQKLASIHKGQIAKEKGDGLFLF